jgi:hypothetical protein
MAEAEFNLFKVKTSGFEESTEEFMYHLCRTSDGGNPIQREMQNNQIIVQNLRIG